MRASLLLVVVAACGARGTPGPRCPGDDVAATVGGTPYCARYASILGHGLTAGGDRIDIGTDLLFVRGDRAPRQYLDEYPADRPFGVTLSPIFKTADGGEYTLFFGIGGLTRAEWKGPIEMPVLAGERSYVFARDPARRGAYVQMTRRGPAGATVFDAVSGSVRFDEHDLAAGRYRGRFDIVFSADEQNVPVSGTFDISGE